MWLGIGLVFRLLVSFDEPEIHVCPSGDFGENVSRVCVFELRGGGDRLLNEFPIEGDGMGKFGDMFGSTGDVQRVFWQAGLFGGYTNGALRDATELDDALRDEIDVFPRIGINFVKQLVQRDKVVALHVPVRLLGLHHQVDGVCQPFLK